MWYAHLSMRDISHHDPHMTSTLEAIPTLTATSREPGLCNWCDASDVSPASRSKSRPEGLQTHFLIIPTDNISGERSRDAGIDRESKEWGIARRDGWDRNGVRPWNPVHQINPVWNEKESVYARERERETRGYSRRHDEVSKERGTFVRGTSLLFFHWERTEISLHPHTYTHFPNTLPLRTNTQM